MGATVHVTNIQELNNAIDKYCKPSGNGSRYATTTVIYMTTQLRGSSQLNMGNINADKCQFKIDPNLSGNSDLNIGNIHAGKVSLGGSVSGHAQENIGSIHTGLVVLV